MKLEELTIADAVYLPKAWDPKAGMEKIIAHDDDNSDNDADEIVS
jgi:hypothetical protein